MEQLEYDLLSLAIENVHTCPGLERVVIREIVQSVHFKVIFYERSINEVLCKMGHSDSQLVQDFVAKNSCETTLERKFNLQGRYDFMKIELLKEMDRTEMFHLLDKAFPNCKGYFNVSRVGFSEDKQHALLYLGWHHAWQDAHGWFELWRLNQETSAWEQEKTETAWYI